VINLKPRKASIKRSTKETNVQVSVNIDGTGSPASLMDSKCNPLTTLPFFTSRQGMIRFVSVMLFSLHPQLKFYSHIVLFQESLQMHFFLLHL